MEQLCVRRPNTLNSSSFTTSSTLVFHPGTARRSPQNRANSVSCNKNNQGSNAPIPHRNGSRSLHADGESRQLQQEQRQQYTYTKRLPCDRELHVKNRCSYREGSTRSIGRRADARQLRRGPRAKAEPSHLDSCQGPRKVFVGCFFARFSCGGKKKNAIPFQEWG